MLLLILVVFAFGLTLGCVIGGFAVFRATPWLIGRLTEDERLAFARKVRTHARRKEQP